MSEADGMPRLMAATLFDSYKKSCQSGRLTAARAKNDYQSTGGSLRFNKRACESSKSLLRQKKQGSLLMLGKIKRKTNIKTVELMHGRVAFSESRVLITFNKTLMVRERNRCIEVMELCTHPTRTPLKRELFLDDESSTEPVLFHYFKSFHTTRKTIIMDKVSSNGQTTTPIS